MSARYERLSRYAYAFGAACAAHARRFWRAWAVMVIALIAALYGGYSVLLAAPSGFTPGIVVIAPGSTLRGDAQKLADAHIVKHARVLEVFVRLWDAGSHIQEGAYLFSSRENLLIVAWRLVHGDFEIPSQRVTFPEGTTVREMANKVAAAFPQISASDFIAAGQPYEGYLFPDTYTFAPSATAESIVKTMRDNFAVKTASLQAEASSTGHSFADLVTMASLVQDEASNPTDQRLIAGVLWNRIAKRMPLQVDAVFGYIYGRPTYSPSLADLKVYSPYNTYLYAGLPPGPIGNPGLSALDAAEHSTKSDYLFYFADKNGTTHYAATYAQQLANERRYR